MNVEETLYQIREIYNNSHYCVRVGLDYEADLYKVFDCNYKYVWVLEHSECQGSWTPCSNTLFKRPSNSEHVFVRNDTMEVLMETGTFLDILKNHHFFHATFVQTNIMPPFHLTADKFVGKKKYDMFKDHIDYLFELEIESDYICFVSSRKEVLETILGKIGVSVG